MHSCTSDDDREVVTGNEGWHGFRYVAVGDVRVLDDGDRSGGPDVPHQRFVVERFVRRVCGRWCDQDVDWTVVLVSCCGFQCGRDGGVVEDIDGCEITTSDVGVGVRWCECEVSRLPRFQVDNVRGKSDAFRGGGGKVCTDVEATALEGREGGNAGFEVR